MSELCAHSRVFVVDDEFIIASTLATILQRNGFDAVFFTEPLAVLPAAREQAPDLLIADVMMPGLSGIDLAIALKQECPDCKVLLFSGQAATSDLLQAARDKGYNFRLLSKPVHPTDLLCEVGTLPQQPEREPKQQPFRRRVGALPGDSALGAPEATAGPHERWSSWAPLPTSVNKHDLCAALEKILRVSRAALDGKSPAPSRPANLLQMVINPGTGLPSRQIQSPRVGNGQSHPLPEISAAEGAGKDRPSDPGPYASRDTTKV